MRYLRTLPDGRTEAVPPRKLDGLAVKNRHLRGRAASALYNARYPKPPEACPKCGATNVRMDSHHADYAKPYEVEWFCHPCHMRHHAELRAIVARELGLEVRP